MLVWYKLVQVSVVFLARAASSFARFALPCLLVDAVAREAVMAAASSRSRKLVLLESVPNIL